MRKMGKLVLGAVVAILGAAQAFAVEFRRAQPVMDDVFAASCRVSVQGARGSGTFVGVAQNNPDVAYVLTNYHVVGRANDATVDFWANGRKQSVRGKVVQRAYDAQMPADFAIIAVDANELKHIDPPFVALGGRDAQPGVKAFFLSSGGPKGWAVKAWRGQTLGYYNGATALFQPHPVPGQSGSGIFEVVDDELFQTGIVTWLIGTEGDDNAQGGAIPIANLYRALQGRYVVEPDRTGSPIPPNAKECADRPKMLYFRRDNCSACDVFAPELQRLEELGDVEIVNCDEDAGLARALEYGVVEVPTLVVDGAVVRFDAMQAKGLFQAAKDAHASPTPLETDFTMRPAVREITGDVGLLDDSDERWNFRGKRSEKEPEPETAPETAKLGDSSALQGLGEKLGEGLRKELTEGLSEQFDALAQKVTGKVENALKTTARRNALKLALFALAFYWLVKGSGLGIKGLASWTWKKLKLAISEASYRVWEKVKEDKQ